MPSTKEIERALLQAGEPRSGSVTDGFHVKALRGGVVVVRWRSRKGLDTFGLDVAFVEGYAPILRDAGFNATVKVDVSGVRVVCLPSAAPQWNVTVERALRAVS